MPRCCGELKPSFMDILALIISIRQLLQTTFDDIDHWFDKDEVLRQFQPPDGGWTIDEILEHISLTNHFLLILIEKGAAKALQNADKTDLQAALQTYHFHTDKLGEVGVHLSFPWIRPVHMEPTGLKPMAAVRELLNEQCRQCLDCLDRLPNGEGILYKTTMTVNDLGKIDVYEYIGFLAQHGRRHVAQMAKIEAAFLAKSSD